MAPNCKIINFEAENTDWLRQLILGAGAVGSFPGTGSRCWSWSIVTKYYRAEVELHFMDCDEVLAADSCADFSDTEAVIFHCSSDRACLEQSDLVWGRVKETCPAVCLYVVPSASDEVEAGGQEARRTEILDWCLTHQFELVEFEDGEEGDSEDEFDEREGRERIVSALKAHTWSNLELVEGSSGPHMPPGQESLNQDTRSNLDLNDSDDDGGEDMNFEDIFSQLSKMKEISKNLPEDERKVYAEKMALAFYKSIGGGSDEDDD